MIITIILIIFSLFIHEWSHIIAVCFLGGKIEKIGLAPLGIMARVRGLERLHPWERYVIYAAGSAANFAIMFWAWLTSYMSYAGVAWLEDLAFYNLVLGLFNLTPVLPLDGGKILWQFMGNKIGILNTNRFIKRLGIAVGFVFILLGIIQIILYTYNITLLCAGVYIFRKNKNISAELQAAFHTALDGKNCEERVRLLPVKTILIPHDTPVKYALERLTGDYFINFKIVTPKNDVTIREQTLITYIFNHGITGTVNDIIDL